MVDIDPAKLYGKGLSPADVSNALNAQNVILPAGTQKIGDREYNVRLNSSPELLQALNDLPIKQVNNAMVYIRDVAQVRDGFAVQTNIVAQNRTRSALLTVLKSASASTLDIISRVKAALPRIKATLPPELDITQLFDQSIFVRAAINGVLKEGVIAACLTALMILLFLGSWRSTLVVATSIPLSILCSIIILSALGQTMNLMTLGGLALAVGILVDDATVEIENIHRNLAMRKPMVRAILDGASQIAVPAFQPVGRDIRSIIPAAEMKTVLDNIGLPASGINLAFSDNATISEADGEILVALDPANHKPVAGYMRTLREKLHRDFPDMDFYFAAPDIVSQILNFGLPAPIDVQVTGRDPKNYEVARQ